jgi:hypothetical protein
MRISRPGLAEVRACLRETISTIRRSHQIYHFRKRRFTTALPPEWAHDVACMQRALALLPKSQPKRKKGKS